MGRSAKLMKRPSKQDREAKKIIQQSRPRAQQQPDSDDDDAAGRTAIPLFNTSARGRATTKPDPRLAASSGDALDVPTLVDAATGEPDLAMDEDDGEAQEEASTAAGKKKKGSAGLRDKVRKAKEMLKEDEARSDAKLGSRGPKKGKKEHVLKGVDYVKLHEKVPGKKRFR
ncbi:hypothetical protein JCM6882_009081 [Rhodosporidiobolus microsporus]